MCAAATRELRQAFDAVKDAPRDPDRWCKLEAAMACRRDRGCDPRAPADLPSCKQVWEKLAHFGCPNCLRILSLVLDDDDYRKAISSSVAYRQNRALWDQLFAVEKKRDFAAQVRVHDRELHSDGTWSGEIGQVTERDFVVSGDGAARFVTDFGEWNRARVRPVVCEAGCCEFFLPYRPRFTDKTPSRICFDAKGRIDRIEQVINLQQLSPEHEPPPRIPGL